jgi:uncharacterized DUF497 family protein
MWVKWDEPKRQRNFEDHGVDFLDAALIFEGVSLKVEDQRSNYGEPRFRALGRIGDADFMVACTWRGGTRRITSTRRVDDEGERRYEAILARNPQGGARAVKPAPVRTHPCIPWTRISGATPAW